MPSGDDIGTDTSGEGSVRGVDTDTGESVSGDSSSSSGSGSTGSVATPPPRNAEVGQLVRDLAPDSRRSGFPNRPGYMFFLSPGLWDKRNLFEFCKAGYKLCKITGGLL